MGRIHRRKRFSTLNILFHRRKLVPCYYCGVFLDRKYATIEHLKKLIDGGKHHLLNMTVACAKCNSNRGRKTVKEYKIMRAENKIIPDLIIFLD